MRNAIGKMKEKRDTEKCRRIQISTLPLSFPTKLAKTIGGVFFIY